MTGKQRFKFLITLGLTFILFIFSEEIAESIRIGIKTSVFCVIPAIFPFLILADYLSSGEINFPCERIISKIFSIPRCAAGALVSGIICGFPSGVKCAMRLYEAKIISKKDLESLIGIVNNPSMAFVLSAVGLGMLNSLRDGFLCFSAMILSIIVTSKLVLRLKLTENSSKIKSDLRFDFVKSVKDAGISSVNISSYIIFFSAVLGVFRAFVKSDVALSLFASLLEIGNSTSIITSSTLNPLVKFLLLGFSLGFSGLSVHLQAFSVINEKISTKKYFKTKFVQGAFCAFFALIFKLLFTKL